MLKVMEKIEYSRGKNVLIDSPLSMVRIDKQVSPIDARDDNMGYVLHQTLSVATQTRVHHGADSEEIEMLNRRAAQMFTAELYGEVAADLFILMRYCHEHIYDREVMNKIDALMRKVRP
jgi:hypothetical protein